MEPNQLLREVLVACRSQVVRLDPTGSVIQAYPAGTYGSSFFFALNIDPDGSSFWTADYPTGKITRIDIATGAQITQFTAALEGPTLAGLAVFGEQTVATTTTTSTTSTTTSTTTTTVPSTTSTTVCKPGYGYGDKNHCHSGPPGRQRRTEVPQGSGSPPRW